MLVPTYVGQAPEAVTQLLVRDARGRRLFRMRGNFWQPADLRAVADSLPVRAVVIDEPMPLSEFFRAYPDSAYWFEDKPGSARRAHRRPDRRGAGHRGLGDDDPRHADRLHAVAGMTRRPNAGASAVLDSSSSNPMRE